MNQSEILLHAITSLEKALEEGTDNQDSAILVSQALGLIKALYLSSQNATSPTETTGKDGE